VAFTWAINARTRYYNKEGSDDILNAIITQTRYAGDTIAHIVRVGELLLMTPVYAGIAFFISPALTVLTGGLLGGITYLFRSVVEPAGKLGDSVADANEKRQQAAQAGTQGTRDIRIFGFSDSPKSFVMILSSQLIVLQKRKSNCDEMKLHYESFIIWLSLVVSSD
jgi:subfamily B ATP-binding cassette protein MsbA